MRERERERARARARSEKREREREREREKESGGRQDEEVSLLTNENPTLRWWEKYILELIRADAGNAVESLDLRFSVFLGFVGSTQPVFHSAVDELDHQHFLLQQGNLFARVDIKLVRRP